ncbi:MAG: 50S ribosomal protein L11 methyltransferase [Pseudoflavonifractor sp.]|nr:50S ribosomal protein L11 methyltransferase [Alloprevotella sp.]MCM1117457.1 50S ribosomal protein L11 methyltransferase [Pseudoflavonifractor sp.]
MNDYIKVRLDLSPTPTEAATDLLAAFLADEGFESFEPDALGLSAYILADKYDPQAPRRAFDLLPFGNYTASISSEFIKGEDWNAEWERNYFKPIVIAGKAVIHSSFHTDIPPASYDIVIDPKMAFGTGHHSTTTLIATRLLEMPLEGLAVTDVGSGTGILAILAAMRGATPVNAIEIDPPAWENALENVKLNSHPEINVILGDASALDSLPKADLLLANINRNIILADMEAYARAVKPGGRLIFSGFYSADIPLIQERAASLGLTLIDSTDNLNWASTLFQAKI